MSVFWASNLFPWILNFQSMRGLVRFQRDRDQLEEAILIGLISLIFLDEKFELKETFFCFHLQNIIFFYELHLCLPVEFENGKRKCIDPIWTKTFIRIIDLFTYEPFHLSKRWFRFWIFPNNSPASNDTDFVHFWVNIIFHGLLHSVYQMQSISNCIQIKKNSSNFIEGRFWMIYTSLTQSNIQRDTELCINWINFLFVRYSRIWLLLLCPYWKKNHLKIAYLFYPHICRHNLVSQIL